jgi:hypothetical protein
MVELGRYLERMRRLERDVDAIRDDVSEIRHMIHRIALLALLWGGALILMLGNERAAEVLIRLLALRGS